MSLQIVSAAEWLALRKELQAAEEKAMQTLEEIATRRRDLTPLGRQDETVELLHHDKYQ